MNARSPSFTLVFLLRPYFASIQSLSATNNGWIIFLYMNISLHFRAGKIFFYFNRKFEEKKKNLIYLFIIKIIMCFCEIQSTTLSPLPNQLLNN